MHLSELSDYILNSSPYVHIAHKREKKNTLSLVNKIEGKTQKHKQHICYPEGYVHKPKYTREKGEILFSSVYCL